MALGVVVGPGLGVLVDRLIDRTTPTLEHRCANCRCGLGRRSLRPVIGWWQRCDDCGLHKGRRYPLIDIATAALFGSMALRFDSGWMLGPYLVLVAVLVVLSAVDFETHRLPNVVVWPSFVVSLFVIFVISGQRDYASGIYSALLGCVVFAGFLGIAHLIHEPGMGLGDVKLALTLGLFLGWLQPGLVDTTRLVLGTIFVALVTGAIGGIIYNTIRSRGRSEVPFGPALAAATLAAVLVSGTVFDTVSL
jgi:leader peptidase (prepilin peptidase)/N-methyltransferase